MSIGDVLDSATTIRISLSLIGLMASDGVEPRALAALADVRDRAGNFPVADDLVQELKDQPSDKHGG